MNPIRFECPHCHEITAGDESLYGQRVTCRKCRAAILVPLAPVNTGLQTARLIQEPAAAAPPVLDEADQETHVFKLSPVARAFPGQILLGVIFTGLGMGLAIRAQDFSWPRWVALVPLALGVLLLMMGMLCIITGLLGEVLARTYHEATGTRIYTVRSVMRDRRRRPGSL